MAGTGEGARTSRMDWVLPVSRMSEGRKVPPPQWAPRRARRPSPGRQVPKGIPFALRPEEYPHLARNRYGSADMSKYTPEQWLQTGLPYCKECMTHPGQVRQRTVWNPVMGCPVLAEPCPHGFVLTERRARALYAGYMRRSIIQNILVLLFPIGGLAIAALWLFVVPLYFLWFLVILKMRRSYRGALKRLSFHSPEEVQGVWARGRRGRIPYWARDGGWWNGF